MPLHRIVVVVGALALLAACNRDRPAQTATSDQTGTPAVVSSGMPPAMGAMATLADFAPRAAASNLYEVEAGKLAQARGGSADVKAFGRMMQADHAKSAADLNTAITASGRNITPPTTLPADRQAMLDALGAAPAGGFDRAYLDQQETAHGEALTLMKAYADKGDVAQVKAFAAAAAPIVQMHLDRVKQLKAAMAK